MEKVANRKDAKKKTEHIISEAKTVSRANRNYVERLAKLIKVRDDLAEKMGSASYSDEKEKTRLELQAISRHIQNLKGQATVEILAKSRTRWKSTFDSKSVVLVLTNSLDTKLMLSIRDILMPEEMASFQINNQVSFGVTSDNDPCQVRLTVLSQFDDPMSLLAPVKDLGIKVDTEGIHLAIKKIKEFVSNVENLSTRLKTPALIKYDMLKQQRDKLATELSELKNKMSNMQAHLATQVADVVFAEKLLQTVTWEVSSSSENDKFFVLKHPLCADLNMLHNLMGWNDSTFDTNGSDSPSLKLAPNVMVTQFLPVFKERSTKRTTQNVSDKSASEEPPQIIITFEMPREKALSLISQWGIKTNQSEKDAEI